MPSEVSDHDVRLMTAVGTFAGPFLAHPTAYSPYRRLIENYRSDAGFGIAKS
ncbi:hypothetical protein [Bradyrhizobium sp. CCBAU 21359]|uniref:hypothetical protein n=1 Tax=Bradyrhizobium sp. CCBAU 21359 TaxID=1325080 RepID=UPI002304F00F|nr:hypothetical protein [Bradyrhizobium sp. CCBAU 21359]